jgi:hypothetical protein
MTLYEGKMDEQARTINEVIESKAVIEGAKHGAQSANPYARQSFGEDFVSRLASRGPELASGLAGGLRGLLGGSAQFPGSPGTGVSGIGPVASGSTYGNWLNATSGTSGIGPWANGDAYGHALGTYR